MVRDSMEEASRRDWSQIALRLIQGAFPFQSDDERTWPESLRLLPRALAALGHAEQLGAAGISGKFGIRLFQAIRYDMDGRHSDAVDICRRILAETIPGDARSYATACIRLAEFYDHQDQPEEALKVLDGLLSQPGAEGQYGEKYWWALYQKGIMLRRIGRYAQAEKVLNEVYAVYQKEPKEDYHTSVLHQLGVIDLKQHRYAEAEEKFRRCMKERRNDESNHRMAYEHRRLGQVYALTGRLKEARDAFDRAIAIARACNFRRYVQETEQDIRKYCASTLA